MTEEIKRKKQNRINIQGKTDLDQKRQEKEWGKTR